MLALCRQIVPKRSVAETQPAVFRYSNLIYKTRHLLPISRGNVREGGEIARHRLCPNSKNEDNKSLTEIETADASMSLNPNSPAALPLGSTRIILSLFLY